MAKPRIPPVLKRAIRDTFRKPATTKYPYVQPKLNAIFGVNLCLMWTAVSVAVYAVETALRVP